MASRSCIASTAAITAVASADGTRAWRSVSAASAFSAGGAGRIREVAVADSCAGVRSCGATISAARAVFTRQEGVIPGDAIDPATGFGGGMAQRRERAGDRSGHNEV
jgi:hypothetical protein